MKDLMLILICFTISGFLSTTVYLSSIESILEDIRDKNDDEDDEDDEWEFRHENCLAGYYE